MRLLKIHLKPINTLRRSVSYKQGQEPEKKIREYFYYVDHNGMLKANQSERYTEFPYISLCGRERNYLRCDDKPFVYTSYSNADNTLEYNYTGLTLRLEPEKVFMSASNGRVYHPAPDRVGKIGLLHTKLALEFSKRMRFENGDTRPPTHLIYKEEAVKIDNEWYKHL